MLRTNELTDVGISYMVKCDFPSLISLILSENNLSMKSRKMICIRRYPSLLFIEAKYAVHDARDLIIDYPCSRIIEQEGWYTHMKKYLKLYILSIWIVTECLSTSPEKSPNAGKLVVGPTESPTPNSRWRGIWMHWKSQKEILTSICSEDSPEKPSKTNRWEWTSWMFLRRE